MMTASCAGAKGESSVLLGQDEPEWAQDIVLPVEIPSRDPREVLRWLGKQMLVVAMYDYQAYGVVPHLEWLASVKKPLVRPVHCCRTHGKPHFTITSHEHLHGD